MTNENVQRLEPHRGSPARQVIAVPTQIILNVGPSAQMIFQVGFDLDEGDRVINTRLDRIFHIAERQAARYDLIALETEHGKISRMLEQFKSQLAAAEARYKVEQATRETEIEELTKVAEETRQEGYDAHFASGRQGEYVPRGPVKAKIDGCTAQIEQIKAEMKKKEGERDQHIDSLNNSVAKYEADLKALNEQIAAKKDLLRNDPPEAEPDGA